MRRLTMTTTVLSLLSLDAPPVSVLRLPLSSVGIFKSSLRNFPTPSGWAPQPRPSSGGRCERYLFPCIRSLFPQDRLHPCNVPSDLRDSHHILQLSRGMLKAKIEQLLTQLLFLDEQLPFAQLAEFLNLHRWLPLMMNL